MFITVSRGHLAEPPLTEQYTRHAACLVQPQLFRKQQQGSATWCHPHWKPFLFHWNAPLPGQKLSWLPGYAALITQQASPWLQADCLCLPLWDFQIFSIHSQYSCSQGSLLATENKSPEYLCLTQFSRSQRINDAFSLNLVSGVCPSIPSIPVRLVPGMGKFMNLGPSSTWVSWLCLYFLLLPIGKGMAKVLFIFLLHVPSVTFLSPQSSSICTVSTELKYQMVFNYLTKVLQPRARM